MLIFYFLFLNSWFFIIFAGTFLLGKNFRSYDNLKTGFLKFLFGFYCPLKGNVLVPLFRRFCLQLSSKHLIVRTTNTNLSVIVARRLNLALLIQFRRDYAILNRLFAIANCCRNGWVICHLILLLHFHLFEEFNCRDDEKLSAGSERALLTSAMLQL